MTPRFDHRVPPADLAAVLEAADIAAVLVRPARRDDGDRLAALASVIQGRGAAFLLDGDVELCLASGADGAHLTGLDALKFALPRLKPDRIAGAGGLKTRHDAMLAGEAGADYVMFGEEGPAGHRPSFETIVERVAWWAELFEVPCVGVAATLDEIGALVAAGADFVALDHAIWSDPRGPVVAAAAAADRLASPEPVQ